MPRPGVVNNPNGRPKGCRNKQNERVEKLVSRLMKVFEEDENYMITEFKSLAAKDKFNVLTNLLPYYAAKKRMIEVGEDGRPVEATETWWEKMLKTQGVVKHAS